MYLEINDLFLRKPRRDLILITPNEIWGQSNPPNTTPKELNNGYSPEYFLFNSFGVGII